MKKWSTAFLLVFGMVSLMCAITSVVASASNTIQVCSVLPLSGMFAQEGKEGLAGLTHAVQEINNNGGINGKLIELEVRDGKFSPEFQVPAFKELMTTYRPLAMTVVGPVAVTLAEDMRKGKYKETLLISYAAYGVLAQGGMYPFVLMNSPTLGDELRMIMKYAARVTPNAKVALVYSDHPMGRNPIKFGRYYAKTIGLKIVGEEALPLKGGDISQQMKDIKSAEPEYLFVNGFIGPRIIPVIKAARAAGITCPIFSTHYGAYQGILPALGQMAENYYVVNSYSYYHMDDSPTIKRIREINAACCPDVAYRNIAYMWGYSTMLILADVFKRADKAGELDNKGVIKASREIKKLDTGGITAPLTLKSNRFPVSRIWKADPDKGIFEPAPIPKGLHKWIRMD